METEEAAGDTRSLRSRSAHVALGKDGGYTYHTDFNIDVKKQHQEVWHGVLLETLCPGCKSEDGVKFCARIWLFLSSEPVLLALHILCLILGVLKVCIFLKYFNRLKTCVFYGCYLCFIIHLPV